VNVSRSRPPVTHGKRIARLVRPNFNTAGEEARYSGHNAGASWGATFAEFPENGWDKVMDLKREVGVLPDPEYCSICWMAAGSANSYSRVINIQL